MINARTAGVHGRPNPKPGPAYDGELYLIIFYTITND
jgi:hypothetical protein